VETVVYVKGVAPRSLVRATVCEAVPDAAAVTLKFNCAGFEVSVAGGNTFRVTGTSRGLFPAAEELTTMDPW
jgi:hypothetical protein